MTRPPVARGIATATLAPRFAPSRTLVPSVFVAALFAATAGCFSPPAEFEPNRAFVYRAERARDEAFSAEQKADVERLLADWFGSPDEPKVPKIGDLDFGRGCDSLDVLHPDPGRLLDEDVRRGVEGPARVLGEPVVGHRDDHDVELVPQKLLERPARHPAKARDERVCSACVDVERGDERVGAERRRPLVADQPAADDADA